MTTFVAAIWPVKTLDCEPWLTVAPLRTRPLAEAGMTTPEAEASRLIVPPLTTVPPL